jgi:hypothetical protein
VAELAPILRAACSSAVHVRHPDDNTPGKPADGRSRQPAVSEKYSFIDAEYENAVADEAENAPNIVQMCLRGRGSYAVAPLQNPHNFGPGRTSSQKSTLPPLIGAAPATPADAQATSDDMNDFARSLGADASNFIVTCN